MRCQPPEELSTRTSIVDAQDHVRAEVRSRPGPEDGRLNLIQLERRRGRRRNFARRFLDGQHVRVLYPILSRSSSTALPTRSSRRVSATVRFGLATYQASAAVWCAAMKSF